MFGIQNTGLYKLTTDSDRDLKIFYISYQNLQGKGNKTWTTRIGTIKKE